MKKLIKHLAPNFYQQISLGRFHFKNHNLFTKTEPEIIICFDKYGYHGGFVDRLKGIISIYHLSKLYNYKFKIHFDHPFQIELFFNENKIQWKLQKSDLNWSIFNTKFIYALDDLSHGERIIQEMKNGHRKIFVYTNLDLLSKVYLTGEDLTKIWGQTFNELFIPSAFLGEKLLLAQRNLKLKSFPIAIHTRFTNLLGDFDDVTERFIQEDEKESFLRKNWEKIKEIHELHNQKQLIIFSDSRYFLDYLDKKILEECKSNIIVNPGQPIHSDRAGGTVDDYSKAIEDFILLSYCELVYLLKTGDMYSSSYSKYATYLSNSEFKQINF